jgi:methyltransferase family protein
MGLTRYAAEIGVQQGKYSELLIRDTGFLHFFCIDPWCVWPDTEYGNDSANVDQSTHDSYYEDTVKRLEPYDNVSVLQLTSAEASTRLPDDYLDFVYLDANHSFITVKEDIEIWYPKIRRGGILAGHDYLTEEKKNEVNRPYYGVKKAVDFFCLEHDLVLHLTKDFYTSWYVFKR